jgi:serine/threonine protein kinase
MLSRLFWRLVPLLPSPSDLPSDFGRYRLMSVLGEGGMARVYLSEKSGPMGFSTHVALKIVKRKAGKRSEFVSLLTREAVIGGFLRHPNIVATLDFDQVDGHYYIAMEYVEGKTLEDLIRAARRRREPFPPLLALDLIVQMCRGLAYAHSLCDRDGKPLNIIHRDIKPGNIMVSTHGVAKITDFGIAKASVETGVVTATNVVRGTPLYMSPEQATGRPLDHRSDLFAIGLILYEMLTGRRLFEMKDIVSTMESIARAQIGGAPEELDAIVPGLGKPFRRLMQLHPKARHNDATELGEELVEHARGLARLSSDDAWATASVREQLATLSNTDTSDQAPRERTPTVQSTGARIAADLASIEEMDGSHIRDLVEAKKAADKADETLPWLDPVIRRTAVMLKAVAQDAIDDEPPVQDDDSPARA